MALVEFGAAACAGGHSMLRAHLCIRSAPSAERGPCAWPVASPPRRRYRPRRNGPLRPQPLAATRQTGRPFACKQGLLARRRQEVVCQGSLLESTASASEKFQGNVNFRFWPICVLRGGGQFPS